MAIGRSLTKRTRTPSDLKRNPSTIEKSKISAPVALLSTTNMLSYTAPNLRTSLSQGSLSSSGSSISPGSSSPTFGSYPSSPFSISSSSSPGDDLDSRVVCDNGGRLSTHFSPPPAPIGALPLVRSLSTRSSTSNLSLHRRAPSTGSLGRSDSRRGLVMPPKQLRSATQLPRQSAMAGNPFEVELARVAEMTEELGMDVRDAEEEFMESHGLQKYNAQDYEAEIWAGIGNVFEDTMPAMNSGWI